ncbi:MAG TPA: tetratricopeptide repeat protein [Candidatus Kapabacteria bacterium]|nr:tetratricopeptide repeat protein [Candidatus Kapabacteria bacterium]
MQKKMYRNSIWTAAVALLTIWGCATQREGIRSTARSSSDIHLDSARATEYFITGALHDVHNEYADAILEYQEALQYDNRAPIYYCIAKDYFELGKAERAAQYADSAITHDSTNTLYHSLRAEIALTLQADFGEAQRQYERILALDSDDVQALSDLAGLYQLRGKEEYNKKAVVLYDRILDIDGYDADISLHLAQLYNEMGDIKKSIRALKDVLEDDPSNMQLRETIAQSYIQLNQADSAIDVYTDLLDRFPGKLDLELDLADVYVSNKQWGKAFSFFTAALKNDSLNADTLNAILDSLYSHIQTDTASLKAVQPYIESFARKDPTNWYANILWGGVQLYAKLNTDGDATIRRAIDHATDTLGALLFGMQVLIEHERYDDMFRLSQAVHVQPDYRINFLRAFAYERMKKYPEAIKELNVSLALNGHYWLALAQLGMDYDELHEHERSDSAYAASLVLRPDNSIALNNYSYSLAERGIDLDSAKSMSARALAADPTNVNYLDTYGWILYKVGAYDSAAVYLQRAITDTTVTATVLEHLGDVRFRLGQYKDAMQLWNKALAKDMTNDSLRQKILENMSHEQ